MVGSMPQRTDSVNRKLRKPMIEKKRRDRMNASIEQIKAILAKTSSNGQSIVGKDKAEILELAVSHIAQLQRQKTTGPADITSYMTGYRECARETVRFLSSKRNVPDVVIHDVNKHLSIDMSQSLYPESVRMSTPPLDLTSPTMSATSRRIFNRHFNMSSTPHPPMMSPLTSPLGTWNRPVPQTDDLLNVFSRSSSPLPSPALSSCSISTFDSGISLSGASQCSPNNSADCDSVDVLVQVKSEKPWRPW